MDDFQDSSTCPLVVYILKSRVLVDKILVPLEKGPLGLRFDSAENFVISLSATMLSKKQIFLHDKFQINLFDLNRRCKYVSKRKYNLQDF